MKPAERDADAALRRALLDSLRGDRGAAPEGSEALQQRVMAQWRQRHAQTAAEWVAVGHPAARWQPARAWAWWGLGVLLVAMALVWSQRPDPALEELMQPDVLSQIGLGEL